jgi:hypothetical protein
MIALLLTAVMAVQGPGALQPGTGIVTGTLKSADGRPAIGVRVGAVDVEDVSASSLFSVTETDSAGNYRLINIPAGRYYIVAGKLSDLHYYPRGADRSSAAEINIEAARVRAQVDFTVPGGSQRPVQPAPFGTKPPDVLAYQQFTAEKDMDRKVQLLHQLERNFPKSGLLPEASLSLMNVYAGRGDAVHLVEYAEKAIKTDPENIQNLIQVSRMYAGQQMQMERALQYAGKAATLAGGLKSKGVPANTDPVLWQRWAASIESSAQSNLAWVTQMDAWQRKTLFSLVAPVRKK